jgi:hypothetical protein
MGGDLGFSCGEKGEVFRVFLFFPTSAYFPIFWKWVTLAFIFRGIGSVLEE